MAAHDDLMQVPLGQLGRRTIRRPLVLALAAVILLLAGCPLDLFRSNWVYFGLLIVGLNIVLRRSTRRLAILPDDLLDERQQAVRDRAHRRAYRALAVGTGTFLGFLLLGAGSSDHRWLLHLAENPALVLAGLEVVFFLPTALIAWEEPDALDDELIAPPVSLASRIALGLSLLLFLSLFIWSAGIAVIGNTHAAYRIFPGKLWFAHSSGHCGVFQARREVGRGIGAIVQLNAQVCWDGRHTWQSWGLNRSDCMPIRTAMAGVSLTCSTHFRPDGTMDVRYRGQVNATLLPWVHGPANLTLVVRPDGRVLRFD